MISKIREWTLPIMIVILVSFVIGTIFLNWGMNRGSGTSKTASAGVINGQEIPITYFDRVLNNERQRLEQSGSAENAYQMHQLPQEVWDKEVSRTLMHDFYKKAGLFGTADQIFDYIKHNPPPGIDTNSTFMTNGRFDTAKFVAVLNDPRTYEYNPGPARTREQVSELVVPSENIVTLLGSTALPTRAEIEELFKDENEKAVFEYAYLKSDAIKADLSGITGDAVAQYYNNHKDQFKSDEQTDLYVVKIPKRVTPRDELLYTQELQDTKSKILSEKDVPLSQAFADEAKVTSEDDATAQNGGDLGWIGAA